MDYMFIKLIQIIKHCMFFIKKKALFIFLDNRRRIRSQKVLRWLELLAEINKLT